MASPDQHTHRRPVAEPPSNAAPTIGSDLLWGVAAIAHELGTDVRRVYHALQHEHLPAIKFGTRWVASRSVLRAHFNRSPDPVAQQAKRGRP
jgi:hypothetical protein